MKIKSLSLLITLTISMRVLYASNTKVGNIWYDFNNQNMTASVTFEGAWYEEYSNNQDALLEKEDISEQLSTLLGRIERIERKIGVEQ